MPPESQILQLEPALITPFEMLPLLPHHDNNCMQMVICSTKAIHIIFWHILDQILTLTYRFIWEVFILRIEI